MASPPPQARRKEKTEDEQLILEQRKKNLENEKRAAMAQSKNAVMVATKTDKPVLDKISGEVEKKQKGWSPGDLEAFLKLGVRSTKVSVPNIIGRRKETPDEKGIKEIEQGVETKLRMLSNKEIAGLLNDKATASVMALVYGSNGLGELAEKMKKNPNSDAYKQLSWRS